MYRPGCGNRCNDLSSKSCQLRTAVPKRHSPKNEALRHGRFKLTVRDFVALPALSSGPGFPNTLRESPPSNTTLPVIISPLPYHVTADYLLMRSPRVSDPWRTTAT
jgi:hypothetical protein